MSVPPIPEEARRVSRICRGHNARSMPPQSMLPGGPPISATMLDTRAPCYECALKAAWPLLYAAALRDVAERFDAEHGDGPHVTLLRKWADEAAS